MNDINTLRAYRKRGVRLTYEERTRLAQQDSRRLRRIMKVLYKVACVVAVIGSIALLQIASYTIRGYVAFGAEIFFPLVAVFAWWIRAEAQNEKKTDE